MSSTPSPTDSRAVAREALAALEGGRQIGPFSARIAGFDLAAGYRAAAAVRELRIARGETPIGRKIGFTNRTIWAEYGVWAPIWGYVYDRTVHDLGGAAGLGFSLGGLLEPRIEPEVVFGLGAAPIAGMDEAALLGCVQWVAHGFEIVQSIFPGWKFAAADTVAGFGLHGALLIGPRHPVAATSRALLAALPQFEIDLLRDGAIQDRGRGVNVLDGPLSALRHLVEALALDPAQPPLAVGEVVTTGTLTRAFPVSPGQTWSTVLHGIDLDPLVLRLA
ncbi:MAG TPA: decarboxylase [Burkholderiaceae bacterium]